MRRTKSSGVWALTGISSSFLWDGRRIGSVMMLPGTGRMTSSGPDVSGDFKRPWHNHFDNSPDTAAVSHFCDCRDLASLLEEGIEPDERPVIGLLAHDDMEGLFKFACDFGYREPPRGYLSRCHLCTDIRFF
ncbi:MAG TPA: hypothetical protein VMZ05_05285 [Spirochaetota bacterium]|nr:hypothetical protein [Spirochaetota bacterium]